MTKTTVNRLAHALDDLGSHMDADQNVLTGLTEDYKEGTAAFREKRQPAFVDKLDAWELAEKANLALPPVMVYPMTSPTY